MPRWAPRVDKNQAEVVAKLRQCGCSVLHLHGLGKNAPDLLVCCPTGWHQRDNVLFEVKDPAKRGKGSRGGQSPEAVRIADQKRWIETWPGPAAMVYSFEEAWTFLQTGVVQERGKNEKSS